MLEIKSISNGGYKPMGTTIRAKNRIIIRKNKKPVDARMRIWIPADLKDEIQSIAEEANITLFKAASILLKNALENVEIVGSTDEDG